MGHSLKSKWEERAEVSSRGSCSVKLSTCAGMSLVRALGLKKENLIPVRMSLNTAVETEMRMLGAILEILGESAVGELRVTRGSPSHCCCPLQDQIFCPGL